MTYYLAIDIGASSGRHMLGCVENGVLKLEEIYRFDNGFLNQDGHLIWNIEHILDEVKTGIRHCKEIGKIPATIAIDTWGVDYVLLDENKQVLLPVYCYRDPRTVEGVEQVSKIISFEDLYRRAGIQMQNFNTVYQLYCDKLTGKLERAKHFMMIPDYLSYCLTGVMKNEYTNATTTSLVKADTKDWDVELMGQLGIPKDIFLPLSQPTEIVGSFTTEMRAFAGFDATVVLCPSHDTASAVAACPLEKDSVYISSGTWSLLGRENEQAVLSDAAREANFTNEGGIEYRYRFLKNYMGMWLFQNIRRNCNKQYSYDDMMHMAQNCDRYEYINVNAPEFSAPENMVEAIRAYLGKPDMPLCEVLASVYHSLAKLYTDAIHEVECLTNKTVTAIHIVGGGSQDRYLNALTAQYTKKPVLAGPVEATAIGNMISQILVNDKSLTLSDVRELVKTSFEIREVTQ